MEAATVLVINKTDQIRPRDRERLVTILRHLNPAARWVFTLNGDVDWRVALADAEDEGIDFGATAGWRAEIQGKSVEHEANDFGIAGFVYRADRPFHPDRLVEVIEQLDADTILRSRGFAWLATRHDFVGLWDQKAESFYLGLAGIWFAAIGREEWPEDEEIRAEIESSWTEPWGDRRQEIYFLGQNLDKETLCDSLDDALLDDEEMALGPEGWIDFDDPLPPWDEEDEGEE